MAMRSNLSQAVGQTVPSNEVESAATPPSPAKSTLLSHPCTCPRRRLGGVATVYPSPVEVVHGSTLPGRGDSRPLSTGDVSQASPCPEEGSSGGGGGICSMPERPPRWGATNSLVQDWTGHPDPGYWGWGRVRLLVSIHLA